MPRTTVSSLEYAGKKSICSANCCIGVSAAERRPNGAGLVLNQPAILSPPPRHYENDEGWATVGPMKRLLSDGRVKRIRSQFTLLNRSGQPRS